MLIWLKNGYAPTQRVKKGLVLNDGHNHSIMVKVDFKGYIRQLAVGSLNRRIIQINKNHNINVRILAEIVSLENIGDAPFTVQALMMRPFAVEKQPAEVETVPNLWKGPVEDYWELSGGSRYGIASTDPGVLKASLWRKEGSTAQHPDVRCLSGRNFALAPGAVYRPDVPTAARIRFLPAPAKPAE